MGERSVRLRGDDDCVLGGQLPRTSADGIQPQPSAAIELIHQQPVRWTHSRVVSCDGGGGPTGHPRIFINTDKPEIATCGYCGLPFVSPFPSFTTHPG